MAIRISRFSSSLAALALAATVLVFSACSGPDQTRVAGGLSVGVRTDPHPAELGDNTFQLWVTRDGRKLDGAAVRMRLFMSGMPMNSDAAWTDAHGEGGGKYRAAGDFSMGGDWQVEVAVTPEGGETVTVTFPFQVAWELK
ncbi:MAG: FixH family protein [Nitrospirae bacterium]|nr:FixH family protein [Nitrospirota bacterium]